jgi:hypothetical protein
MDKKTFMESIDSFRSPSVWFKEKNEWQLTDSIENHVYDKGVDAARLKPAGLSGEFNLASRRTSAADSENYILIGRGHVD